MMLGTKDYSALFSVSAAMDFVCDRLGGVRNIIERNRSLCRWAMEMLATAMGTSEKCLPQLLCASMGMVGCPAILGDTWEDSERIRLELRNDYRIVVQKLFPVSGDGLYLRVSVAVYNSEEEFYLLRDALVGIIKQHGERVQGLTKER
jgi:selenocysteine lyase/cysteine desulfurase